MGFFANVFSGFAKFLGLQNSLHTIGLLCEEPECPKDLL